MKLTKTLFPKQNQNVGHMKSIYKVILFIFILFSSLPIFSQQCTSDSLFLVPSGDVSYTQPGFIDPNILPCVQSGSYSELVIPFKTYNQGARLLTLPDSSTVPVAHIYSLKIESISNLPSGLCWITRPSNQTISGEQIGVLIIKGTTSLTSGTYPLSVGVSMDTQGSGSFTYTGLLPQNYQALLGQVVLKVSGSDGICPTVTY